MTAPDATTPGEVGTGRAPEQEHESSDIIAAIGVPAKAYPFHPERITARKAFDTLKARAALHGIGVHELADGTLLVTRWGYSRALPDLRAAVQFLKQQGVQA